MNEHEFAQKLTRQLNQAALKPDVAQRLRNAREQAVLRASNASGWQESGGVIVRFWHHHQAAMLGFLFALLLAMAGTGWHWQQNRNADRELEAQLLADELPVEAFLSERF